jgi:glycosyltransferase involved in cell wall biosynthesis
LDVFALSSRREGLPNVLLEALAMEVPVVATNVGGVVELIVDNHTGLLCPAGDDPALGTMLGRLLADPALRTRLASAGRARVVKEFDFASRMAAEQEVYQALRSARR